MKAFINRSGKIFAVLTVFIVFAMAVIFLSSDISLAASKSKKDSTSKELVLTYDGVSHTYTDVKGDIIFNRKTTALGTLPIVKLDGVLYGPAKELLSDIFGFEYSVDETTGIHTATYPDMDITVTMKAGESTYTVLKAGETTTVTVSKPLRMIANGDSEAILAIPVTKLFKALGYTCSWSKANALYTVTRTEFFDWSIENTDTNVEVNHITRATGTYESSGSMGYIDIRMKGDRQASFDAITVDRTDKLITATIPSSVYLPASNTFNKFGEIVNDFSVTAADSGVVLTFNCFETTEFAYTTSGHEFHIRLMWDYGTETGKETNYSLTIKKPNAVFGLDRVTHQELYDSVKYTKAFKIIIKGDYVSFYKKHPVVINNNKVKKITISLSSAGNTVIKVTTSSLRGYRIEQYENNYVVTLGAPKKIYKNILVMDAGHGDFDNGASHYGYHEKNLNLKMAYTLLKPYFNKPQSDVHIYWTRMNDSFVTLDNRAKFAKKVSADIFISLHMNSASNKSANGTEVYYSTNNNKAKFSGIKSSLMAKMMKNNLVNSMKTVDRGVKSAGFYVIKNNSVPAILIELGFLSGSKDHKMITNTNKQKLASKTIAQVIENIFKVYPTSR